MIKFHNIPIVANGMQWKGPEAETYRNHYDVVMIEMRDGRWHLTSFGLADMILVKQLRLIFDPAIHAFVATYGDTKDRDWET